MQFESNTIMPDKQQHLCTFRRQSVELTSALGCTAQSVAQYIGGRRTQEASFDTSHLGVETRDVRLLSRSPHHAVGCSDSRIFG